MSGVTSAREVARRLGLSHTAIQNAERARRIAREDDGTWNVENVQRGLSGKPARERRVKADVAPDQTGAADDAPRSVGGSGIASTRELARRLGCSHTSLQKAERSGRIAREPNGRWDLEKVRAGLKTRADPTQRAPHGSRGPWAKPAQHFAKLDTDIIGPVRNIHTELESARRALQRAAEQIAALYPEILRLERACDAAIAAQERGSE